jgi:hypothetical protein
MTSNATLAFITLALRTHARLSQPMGKSTLRPLQLRLKKIQLLQTGPSGAMLPGSSRVTELMAKAKPLLAQKSNWFPAQTNTGHRTKA